MNFLREGMNFLREGTKFGKSISLPKKTIAPLSYYEEKLWGID